MTAPGPKLEAGHVLDERYLLERVIGAGGMGTVFAARHLELGDHVAVKVLQSDAAMSAMPEENLERFLREARLAVKIKNEHVVRILDVARGKNGAPPYIVMELLEGIDLGDLLDSLGRVPSKDAIDYVLQAAEALAEAHALGIVHRDLKSSNLYVTKRSDGAPLVKVLDFGISKAVDEAVDVNLTSTSSVFGSPAYMSPEQIRSAKHVDQRTDVWALNVVLYELLTGKLPFMGANAPAMLAAISADPYTPLRKHVPDAPMELERAIHAAFVKDREKRTPSIVAYAEAIAPFGGPGAPASLAAIQRAGLKSSTRSVPAPAIAPSTPTDPVSETVRAAEPVMAETMPEAPVPAQSARRGELGRTDREMIVPEVRAARSSGVGVIAAIAALVIGAGVVGLVFFLKSRPHPDAEFPPPPVVVTVTVTVPAAPPPSVGSVATPVSEAPPAPSPRKPPPPSPRAHPSPAPSAPPKPNNGIPDTSLRQ